LVFGYVVTSCAEGYKGDDGISRSVPLEDKREFLVELARYNVMYKEGKSLKKVLRCTVDSPYYVRTSVRATSGGGAHHGEAAGNCISTALPTFTASTWYSH
jgi:hypothetical protein